MNSSDSNPVGALQELAQAKRGAFPQYQLVKAVGESHCPSFTMEVTLGEFKGVGQAQSKKHAKHEAARNLLAILRDQSEAPQHNNEENPEKVKMEDKGSNVTDEIDSKLFIGNKIGELQECCAARCLPMPTYTEGETKGPPHMRQFTMLCVVGSAVASGQGKTKKEAKKQAAGQVLEMISSTSIRKQLEEENKEETAILSEEVDDKTEGKGEENLEENTTQLSKAEKKHDSNSKINMVDEDKDFIEKKQEEINSGILEDRTHENTPEDSD